MCLGYLPQGPLDLVFTPQGDGSGKELAEATRAYKFLEHIRKVHAEVEDNLKKSQLKYKAIHDRHRVPSTFQVGDLVWLH